ncbi:hypothetical protein IJ798_00730 [Candidatus Saccharibacteria bacterium]|nr:hypothetical protein [Candidatus Saccharibacteria bacterium]
MGQENKNLFNNRLGMRPSRNLSATEELNRISADSNPNPAPTGDIVLSSGAPKSSGGGKKVLIISLIILVFAALVGGAIFFMIQEQGGNGSSSSSSVKGDYKIEFNQFANYLIRGEVKDTALTGTNDSLGNYAFNKAIRGDENTKKSFMEKAYGLYEKFNNDYSASNIEDDDLNARVKSYYGSIKMLYLYEMSDKLSDEEIFREYIEKGEDSARELVDNSYAEMFNSDSEVAKTYAEVLREANSAYLAQLVKYAGVGCVSKENGLDRKCVGLKIPYDDDTKNYEKMSQKVYKMYNSAVSEITNECWNISEAINKNGEES